MKITERIVHELVDKQITQKDFCDEIGIRPTTFTSWKSRGIDPPIKYMHKICQYFGWNADEIFESANEYKSNSENIVIHKNAPLVVDLTKFDKTSIELVTTFNELSLRDKTRVLNYIFALKNEVGE